MILFWNNIDRPLESAWRGDCGHHVMLTVLLVMRSHRGGLFPSPSVTTAYGSGSPRKGPNLGLSGKMSGDSCDDYNLVSLHLAYK